MRTRLALLVALLVSTALPRWAQAQDSPPHHMTKPDGSIDMEVCGACHNGDMSLQRSKEATCTACHAPAVHSGALEHMRADPAAVKRALEGRSKDAPAMPLADDGHMYCGTCHLFHDPKLGEAWLATGWIPPDSGLAGSVREHIASRWEGLAKTYGETGTVAAFATHGTRMLRLPVNDGALCRRCHGNLP